jgi:hypothetical protein
MGKISEVILYRCLYIPKRTVRVHNTTAREDDGLVPIRPCSWMYMPVYPEGEREASTAVYGRPRIRPLKTLPYRINDVT